MIELPPDNIMITRKRKLFKFAHFDAWPNCFSYSSKNLVNSYFKDSSLTDKPLILELAAGSALFSVEMAVRHPDQNFIAIDIKSDRLYTGAKKAQEEELKNVTFLRMQIGEIDSVFAENSIDTIWLTFPDPFLRKRSAKHRLSHISYLRQYRKVLSEAGQLKFKTDNRELFLWSLEQFVQEKWQIHELSFDLHESNLPDDYKIMTSYEKRYVSQKTLINYACFLPS